METCEIIMFLFFENCIILMEISVIPIKFYESSIIYMEASIFLAFCAFQLIVIARVILALTD